MWLSTVVVTYPPPLYTIVTLPLFLLRAAAVVLTAFPLNRRRGPSNLFYFCFWNATGPPDGGPVVFFHSGFTLLLTEDHSIILIVAERVDHMDRILIGNMISMLASVFLILSCWVNTKKSAYLFQILEALTLCISAVFFQAWTQLSTLTLSVLRNYLVMTERYDRRMMWIFSGLIVVFGLAVNNLGVLGLLPLVATVILAICNYYLQDIMAIKWSFLFNCVLWGIFGFAIRDYVSGITQAVTCGIGLVSIMRLYQMRKKDKKERVLEKQHGL